MPSSGSMDETKYSLLQSPTDDPETATKPPSVHSRLRNWLLCRRAFLVFNLALLGLSLAALIVSYRMNVASRGSNQLFKKINNYSPILERLDLPLYNHTMDGWLFDVSHSVFRAEPGPESDAAWERVSKLGPMVMSGEEVRKIGKNPDDVVKAPLEWGYGDNAYIWQFEMQHNIHCLSFIRQYAYFDHYLRPKYARFEDTPKLDRIHLSHCLYYLLQDLRCQPSFNPIVFHWMDGWRTPHADFNVNRQCINHEAVLQWQIENKVDPKGKVIEKPPTAKILHGPPGMEQLFEE